MNSRDVGAGAQGRFTDMVAETPDSFRINPRIYDTPGLFDEEMERIFGNTWVYVAHESEVPDAGSFVTSTVGLQPVIVVRGQDRKIRVFLNVCLHRGNALCREASGTAKSFVCRYHAWAYSTEGALIHLSEPDGYSEQFRRDKDKFGLLAARCGIYRGLIFANLGSRGETLEDYLGEAKRFIDLWADLSPTGSLRVRPPHSYQYRGNWKFQVENSVDLYHPPFVHRSGFAAFGRMASMRATQNEAGPVTYGFDQGHSVLQRPGFSGAFTPEQYQRYRGMLVDRYGPERAKEIAEIRHIHIFPNVCLMESCIRVIQPVAVDATHVVSYFTELAGVPEDINIARLSDVQWRLGTVGLVGTDDIDIFCGSQTGIRARGFKQVVLDRGIASEIVLANDTRQGEGTSETPQRATYRGWLRAMSA